MKTLILIPAYLEAARLPAVLKSLRKTLPDADVLVVDDGSPDATAEVARQGGAQVVSHPFNLGYGSALQTGYLYAQRHGYQAVAQMDADGQHEPECLRGLLTPLWQGNADLVIGSRWRGQGTYRTSFARRCGQLFFAFLASTACGTPLSDPTSGFKAVNASLVPLYASRAFPHDYPDADWLLYLARKGARIMEVPVSMHADTKGALSMHGGWKPLFYLPKVLLSLVLNTVRNR